MDIKVLEGYKSLVKTSFGILGRLWEGCGRVGTVRVNSAEVFDGYHFSIYRPPNTRQNWMLPFIPQFHDFYDFAKTFL
jgi:hypothetical protein